MTTYDRVMSKLNAQGVREQVRSQMPDVEVANELSPYVELSLSAIQIAEGTSATLSLQLKSQPLSDESRVDIAREINLSVIVGDAEVERLRTDAQGAASLVIYGAYVGNYSVSVGLAHNAIELEVI